jgi:hypothetical protein
MAYDLALAKRLDQLLLGRPGLRATRMFGGVGYLLNGNMCVGIWKDCLILRVGQAAAALLLDRPWAGPMDITGRPMKGWVMVSPEGFQEERELAGLVDHALKFVSGLPVKP